MSDTAPILVPGADELLQQANAGGAPYELKALSGGANNKVFRINIEGRAPLVLKHYFFSPEDTRDRFHAEKSFYDFLLAAGSRQIPQALAWDREHRLGLFSWVEGRRLRLDEVTTGAIDQALKLYLDANARLGLPEANVAPQASDACFDLSQNLASVERRLSRFSQLESSSLVDTDAIDFIAKELKPSYQRYHEIASKNAHLWKQGPRCLSPSDFGFHNALLQADGQLAFFDFEYAGWDDPTKFLCDFLCQPAVPIPPALWSHCIRAICRDVPGGARQEHIAILLPIYQIKWCCILLNEFLPQEQKRRVFSLKLSPAELETKKRDQLNKARTLLKNLTGLDLP